MISLDSSKPVILLVTGKPGTGKSTLAGGIAPPVGNSFSNISDADQVFNPWNMHPIHWHEYSSLPPLQAIYAARTRIEGENEQERQRYEILRTLLDVYNHSPLYGAPPFARLMSIVEELMRADTNDADQFFSFAQSLIEEADPYQLFKHMEQRISERYLSYKSDVSNELRDLEEEYPDKVFRPKLFGVVISDIKSQREYNHLSLLENTICLGMTCDEEVRLSRLEDDDPGIEIDVYSVDFTLDTTTEVEKMILRGDPLPVTDEDNRRGKKKGKERCAQRLKGEEFDTLLANFRSLFQTENNTDAQSK